MHNILPFLTKLEKGPPSSGRGQPTARMHDLASTGCHPSLDMLAKCLSLCSEKPSQPYAQGE